MGRGRLAVVVRIGFLAVALAVLGSPARAADGGLELWVDGANAGCSDALAREQVTASTPWCTIAAAAAGARAGDTVWIAPGRYVGGIRPASSGSADTPIRYVAAADGVTIDANGDAVGLKLIGVSYLDFAGIAITRAASQGVYIDSSSDLLLTRMQITGNGGHGIQLRASGVTVSASTISSNAIAGIQERAGSNGNRYADNTIASNGHDGYAYSGDGIQLNGTGAVVSGNSVTGNGDPGPYEHGIYAASAASNYVIESNSLSLNAGSNVKAAGSNGIVRYNRIGDSRLGLVVSDNAVPVTAYYNVIAGRFQHAVFLTTDRTPARARLWNNTIVQQGRLTTSGEASAVFVNSAASLDFRNNLVCYAGDDNLGVSLWVNDASLLGSLLSDTNWFCSRDSRKRHLAWNGTRVTLSAWRSKSGQDARSIASSPPTFDAQWRVVSDNLGRARGQQLGLSRDFLGDPVPSAGNPDVGAFQSPTASS